MSATGPQPRAGRGSYFFLSYAHVPPLTDIGLYGGESATVDTEPDVEDPVVERLFKDLSEEVGRRASRPEMLVGFYDRQIAAGVDWSAALAEALGAAEVLVPLYSPSYVNGVWSVSERRSFQGRLDRDGGSRAHVQPVLWIPIPGARPYHDDDPLAIGAGIDGYAEDGLRAMRELTYLNDGYRAVVNRLAQKIVAVAEEEPLSPSHAEQPADLVDEVSPNAQFIVAVVAPREAELRSTGRSTSRYGRRGSQWRPFAGAAAARQVATIAERLGLPTDIVDLPEGTAELHTHPTILLIDPWIMALRDGRERLSGVLTEMEAWVTPVVLTDADDPEYADRGERLFRDALRVLDTGHVERAAAQGINHVETFVSTMPRVIDQTRGSFLRNGPTYAPPGEYPPRPMVFKDPAHEGSGETE